MLFKKNSKLAWLPKMLQSPNKTAIWEDLFAGLHN